MTTGVYCLTSPNGKRYVGIGMGVGGIAARWKKYRSMQCKTQRKLFNAFKCHGPDNFKYEVVLVTTDRERAERLEKQLIALWGLQNDRFGYNISDGGHSSNGWKVTPEISKRMSLAHTGNSHSQETKDKISLAHSGKKLSVDHIKNLKLVKRTQETKEKLRLAQTGKKLSQATRNKMKESQIQRRLREQHGH